MTSDPAQAQGLLCGGAQWLGGEGGDGLPQAHENEIHGCGRPDWHVSTLTLLMSLTDNFVECESVLLSRESFIDFLFLSECCGGLEHYDKAFDRVTTRNEKPLKSIKRIFHTVTTTDDPVIRKVLQSTLTHNHFSCHCLCLTVLYVSLFLL